MESPHAEGLSDPAKEGQKASSEVERAMEPGASSTPSLCHPPQRSFGWCICPGDQPCATVMSMPMEGWLSGQTEAEDVTTAASNCHVTSIGAILS